MFTARFANIFSKGFSILFAILFIAGGLFFFFRYDPDAYDMETTGTIVEIEEHYELIGDDNELVNTVYIDYTVNDTKYSHAVYPSYHSGMKEGDPVTFFYMSSDPSQIADSDKNLAPYFGLGFAIVGLIMLLVTIWKIIRRKAF